MQFSRYILTDALSAIRNIKYSALWTSYLRSLITGKTSYINSSSRLIRVSTGLDDSYLAPSCFRQDSLSNACFIFIRLPACCFLFWSGAHLLSHTVSSAVPSADWVLTVVFGMGTGVSPNRIGTRRIKFYLLDNSTVKHIFDLLLLLPF